MFSDIQGSDIRICQLCALRPEDSVGMGCVGSQFLGRSGSDPCEQRGQLQYCGQVRRPIAVGNKSIRIPFSSLELVNKPHSRSHQFYRGTRSLWMLRWYPLS
jgi:hypothetical protein